MFDSPSLDRAAERRPLERDGWPTRYVHPSDEHWGVLLARDRHAWMPQD